MIESRAKTKKGLETYVNIVDKIYETGKKASSHLFIIFLVDFQNMVTHLSMLTRFPDFFE